MCCVKVPLVCVLISQHLKTQIVKSTWIKASRQAFNLTLATKVLLKNELLKSDFEENMISKIPMNNSDYYCNISIIALYFQNVFLNSLLCNFMSVFSSCCSGVCW